MNVERKPAQSVQTSSHTFHRIRLWQEILFSLNLTGVFLYWFLSYCQSFGFGEFARLSDLGYYLRSSALRLDDFLHIASADAQFVRYTPRFVASRSASAGADLLIVISALAFAFLMFSLLHAATGPAIRKRFAFATGMIAIFAMPMMYVWLLKISWARGAAYAFWQDFRPAFLGAEIVVAVLLVGISRLRSLSLWTTAPLVMSHCIFWLYFSWPHLYALSQQELLSPRFFMLAFPLSGLIWLLYWQTAHTNQPQPGRDVGRVRLALGALAAIVFLLLAWWPSHAHPIGGNGQLDSLVIELDRSRCFGSCLPYDMTIRGDGDVRFTGWHRYRETEYTNHATLAPEQVSQIVQALNRSRFFALDDRAFDWCFDTPTVSISVTVNGKSKSVGSDSDCFGPKFGRQARFVQATAEIDSIVGTSRWIQR